MSHIQKGFTLIELLVVIAIIGIMASIVLVSFSGASDKAKIAKAKSDLGQILRAIQMLELDTNCWPKRADDLICNTPYVIYTGGNANEIEDLSLTDVGITGDDDGVFPDWAGPYLDANSPIWQDPWGNNYFLDTDYEVGGSDVVALGSYGPNGGTLNAYDADDIIFILAE